MPQEVRVIPSADPRASYLAHQAEIDAALRGVLEGGRYILGPQVEQFEREFAGYLGVAHAIGVASGTDALHLALRAVGIGPGDLVATVSNTAVATVAAIELAGAQPLLVDVELSSCLLDMNRLDEALGAYRGKIKAVVPVHLFGNPVNMPSLMSVATREGVRVVEDCAQAHGGAVAGKKVGGFGHAAAFSFYPTKNLGALGDGGAVVTNDAKVAEQCRRLRQYGWRERYISESTGINSRLDEVQAAVLRVKLKYLDRDNARRRQIAQAYSHRLAGGKLALPATTPDAAHVYHQYVVRTAQRDQLREHLQKAGVGTQVLYPVPIHQQPAYHGRIEIALQGLATTEALARQILCLPIYPQLEDAQVQHVADAAAQWAVHG
jgi:dTDP-4-amino-4,6-dideoxygalactose transaminase